MRAAIFLFLLLITLPSMSLAQFGFYGQAQTGSPPCHADGSPRDESGQPHCCADGSPPNGESQCWCEPQIVRGKYRNPKHEYEVDVPDGIAEIVGCSGIGNGFNVSLAHPESGEGDWSRNQILVRGSERPSETFQSLASHWSQNETEDSERVHATDLQLDQAQQTSLSSLPALHLKRARTERSGRMVGEMIIANSPDKRMVYVVGMLTPADQYEKNKKLFKEIVDGFRYAPAEQRSISTPE